MIDILTDVLFPIDASIIIDLIEGKCEFSNENISKISKFHNECNKWLHEHGEAFISVK